MVQLDVEFEVQSEAIGQIQPLEVFDLDMNGEITTSGFTMLC